VNIESGHHAQRIKRNVDLSKGLRAGLATARQPALALRSPRFGAGPDSSMACGLVPQSILSRRQQRHAIN
jgi:hypothetical protein